MESLASIASLILVKAIRRPRLFPRGEWLVHDPARQLVARAAASHAPSRREPALLLSSTLSPTISILAPAFNEELRSKEVFAHCSRSSTAARVIVISDGSKDQP